MKDLPKPQKDLPLPEKDLPLPEKEIPAPDVNKMSLNSKWVLICIAAVVLFLISAVSAYLLLQNNAEKKAVFCTQEAKLCPDGITYVSRHGSNCEFSKCPTSPTPTVTENKNGKDNWKTYINEGQNWQIDYPTDENFKIQTHESTQIGQNGMGNVIVFSKIGPTQSTGTELYDGISVTIGVKQKNSLQTIMEFAEKDSLPDPDIGTRTPLKAITINGHKGVETTVSSLGEVKLVYLEYPVYTDRVYYLAIFSTGPGESEMVYDSLVEEILQTFKSYR